MCLQVNFDNTYTDRKYSVDFIPKENQYFMCVCACFTRVNLHCHISIKNLSKTYLNKILKSL